MLDEYSSYMEAVKEQKAKIEPIVQVTWNNCLINSWLIILFWLCAYVALWFLK